MEDTIEDRANKAQGHKATLSNPNVSEQAKQHSREVLSDEYGEGTGYSGNSGETEHRRNVAGGLRAAMNNPKVSDQARESVDERLRNM